jgi:hypothetical protein
MMRVFKTRLFSKWARTVKLSDKQLKQAVEEMEKGLIDADLGGFIYKKRIALSGRGKRGGTRSVIAYQLRRKAFFIFGYAKSEKDNISAEELKIAKAFASELLSYNDQQLDILITDGKLIEVKYEK